MADLESRVCKLEEKMDEVMKSQAETGVYIKMILEKITELGNKMETMQKPCDVPQAAVLEESKDTKQMIVNIVNLFVEVIYKIFVIFAAVKFLGGQ